jgi:glycosyltransferase involved in cell wall biosynthesis
MQPQRLPTISIITPSYNQGRYIEQTLGSVRDQDLVAEHIVMDGGSTDGTVAILGRHPHLIWRSEKDDGQADALNKGLALASGEIIGWVNSDDWYVPNILGSVAAHFAKTSASWVVGNLADVFEEDPNVRFRRSPAVTFDALARNPDIVRQQPTFFRRELLLAAGGWNKRCHMAMDYDLWIRLSRLAPPLMVDENWAYFRNHAAQKTGQANILRQSREITAILRREGVAGHRIAAHAARKRWYWLKGSVKQRLVAAGLVPERYRTRPLRQP